MAKSAVAAKPPRNRCGKSNAQPARKISKPTLGKYSQCSATVALSCTIFEIGKNAARNQLATKRRNAFPRPFLSTPRKKTASRDKPEIDKYSKPMVFLQSELLRHIIGSKTDRSMCKFAGKTIRRA